MMLGHKRTLQIRLFGGFNARWSDGQEVDIRSQKLRAMIAMLGTTQNKTHSRDWLQQMLWSLGDREQGRVNLRRALYEIRKKLGKDADNVIDGNYIDVWLNSEFVELIGDQRDGEFLEGISIPERGFQNWLVKQRARGISPQIRQSSAQAGHHFKSTSILPTIAILPLKVFPRDNQNAVLSDLICMEVCRSLSRSNMLNVISHLSSREIGAQNISMSEVQRVLDADFVTYGSLKEIDGSFMVDIDLADCRTGRLVWSKQIGASTADLFQKDVSFIEELSSDIGYAITNSTIEIAQTTPLPQLDSHLIFLSAIGDMHSDRLHAFAKARSRLEYLIHERNIQDSRLYAWLAHWYMLTIPQGWTTNAKGEVQNAFDCVSRALDINPNCSLSLSMHGMVENSPGHDFSRALSLLSQAKSIEPSNAFAWLLQSRLFAFQGDGLQAVQHANHALKLSPGGPQAYFFENIAATAHVVKGNYGRAIELIDNSLLKNAQHRSSLRVKAVAHEMSGHLEKARDSVNKLRILDPELTVNKYLADHPAGDFETGFEWARSLERAGLPLT